MNERPRIALTAELKWMAKYCPIIKKKVLYLTCLECEDKPCKQVDINNNQEQKSFLDKNQKVNIITK